MLRYGIEIEITKLPPQDVFDGLTILLPEYNWLLMNNNPSHWNVGTDGSVSAEIRSPILVGDWTPVFPVIKALKQLGAQVSRSAGLHVHVSHTDGRFLDRIAIKNLFVAHYGKVGSSYRRRTWTDYDKVSTHYQAVRDVTDNHIEFRMFNGTLNSHAIMNYLRMVDMTMKEYLKE